MSPVPFFSLSIDKPIQDGRRIVCFEFIHASVPLIHSDFSEDAVEHDELDIFLRRNEDWDPTFDEDRPMPEVKPVGVPGAVTPLEMVPEPLRKKILAGSPSPSPLKGKTIPVNKRTDELDVGDDLGDHGLQGVKVTRDELRTLIEELGLAGDDAGDLVKSLSGLSISGKDPVVKDPSPKNQEPQEEENTGLSEAATDTVPAVNQPDATDKATETEDKVGAVSGSASSEAKSENN